MRPIRRTAPSDAPASDDAEASADRRTRALEEPLDVRPRPGTPYARFEVRNPRRKTRYSVLMPEFPRRASAFCSCEDFARRGHGTCKHVEAVLLFAAERPGIGAATPAPYDGTSVWREIEQRIDWFTEAPGPDALRYRSAGAVLIDRAAR